MMAKQDGAKQDGKASDLQMKLTNIFSEVQEKLPSLDFDFSDVSSDEELSIFNRSLKSPTTASSREDVLSPKSWQSALVIDSNEKNCKTNSVSQTVDVEGCDVMGNFEVCSNGWQISADGDNCADVQLGHKTSNSTRTLSDVTLTWTESSTCDEFKDHKESSGHSVENCPVIIERNKNNNSFERRRMNTGGMLKNLSSEEDNRIVSRFITSQAPVLDFQKVEEQQLDHLLNSLPLDSSKDNTQLDVQPGFFDIKNESSSESASSLMNKLAKLCLQQASQVKAATLSKDKVSNRDAHNGHKTVAKRSTGSNIGNNQQKLMSSDVSTGVSTGASTGASTGVSKSVSTGVSIGLSTGVSKGVSTETLAVTCSRGVSTGSNNDKEANRGTIFLDLREKDEINVAKETKVDEPAGLVAIQRILRLHEAVGGCEESDDNDDEDGIDWQKQRKQIRTAISEGQSLKSCNDLPSPRKISRTSKVPAPPRVLHLPPKKEVSESPQQLQAKESESLGLKSRETDVKLGSDEASVKVVKRCPEGHLTDKVKKQKEADSKKLRKQHEEEKAAKHRLQKHLDALKPKLSIGGKSKSCPATDILFDVEASYTKVPDCLPPVAKYNGETLLLSVCLTSCLQIKTNSSAGGRILDSSQQELSATYITLLTWLLSCVPRNFDFLMSPETAESEKYLPFFVVGLQQHLLDGELMLMVAVRPSGKKTPLVTKHKRKKKESKQNCSNFEQAITEFLNVNTLHSVCPNSEGAFSLIISSDGMPYILSAHSQDRHFTEGTYIPELPYINNRALSTFISVQSNAETIERVFKAPVGFFWQILESEYLACDTSSSEQYDNDNGIQNTMSLISQSIYHDQVCMLSILNRILHEGFDICGLRLVYAPEDMCLEVPAAKYGRKQMLVDSPHSELDQVVIEDLNNVGPILVFALRGANARRNWLNIVGPSDPQIARRTDPTSLVALFGGDDRSEVGIYCPRNQDRVNYELALWFGGRVPNNGVVDVGPSISKSQRHKGGSNKKKPARNNNCNDEVGDGNEDEATALSSVPPALLTASTSSDIFLLVSPIISPMCIGTILSTCCKRGFQLRGLRRLRLNSKRTSVLGMTGHQARVFSPVSCTTPTSPQNYDQLLREQLEHGFSTATPSPMPSLVILLRRENAFSQGYSLVKYLMVQLALQGLLVAIQKNISTKLTCSACFHIAPYSESLMANLGGDIYRVPDSERHISLLNQGTFYTNPEMEQVVAVTFVGVEAIKLIGGYLDKMLGFSTTGVELLGFKWLPLLTSAQAKEITPFEVGDRHWHSSLKFLTANPVVICIMRGINAFQRVQTFLGIHLSAQSASSNSQSLEKLLSPTAELAYRQTVIFFSDRELFSDPSVRMNLQYQPPLRNPSLEAISTARFTWADDLVSTTIGKNRGRGGKQKSLVVEESVFKSMTAGPRPITTIAVIKPDSVKRNLVKILKYIAREGFKVVAFKLLVMSMDQATALIPSQYKQNDRYVESHKELLTSRPSLALCLQRENAVKKLVDLCGPVDPKDSRTINQFLWRSIFGHDAISNGLHVSDSYNAAVSEEKLFFPAGLCCQQTQDLLADGIRCPSQDDLICDGNGGRKFIMNDNVVKNDQNENEFVFQAAHSGLCETTCMVLTSRLILWTNQKNQNIYVDILEKLVGAGFQLVGGRMMWLTEGQAGKVVDLFKCSRDKLVPVLTKGPSLVLALQRDNAVTCWETILKSSVASSEIITKYAEQILRPATLPEAHNALGFFFDELCCSSQGEIVLEKQE
ncbi:uncharacterized protein LOC117101002 isoform X3 [Anneissia japonica]|uniref:uncharacterized protein LOC117101002 isoform X3 n=1 Tax=Anneissia japonica TaxID=1529436 RepID=UPI001425B9A1|nr:uncharacterized protein LOC117101002 isoform X3 [Anneissia japonica]